MESATENNRQLKMLVRVKMGGKSARVLSVMIARGKPCSEQDKVGVDEVFRSVCATRVCRLDRWLLHAFVRMTESGLLPTFFFFEE